MTPKGEFIKGERKYTAARTPENNTEKRDGNLSSGKKEGNPRTMVSQKPGKVRISRESHQTR